MGKIVAGLFASVDGVVEQPEKWTTEYFSPEVGKTVGCLMAAADTLLLGRVTYQEFAVRFASGEDPAAASMTDTRKVVVSTTLDAADWQNTTLIRHDVVEEIVWLKRRPGKNINISGSPTLVRGLLREGLLDELHLLVFPVVVGTGKRLFDTGTALMPLHLIDCATLAGGVVHLTYGAA